MWTNLRRSVARSGAARTIRILLLAGTTGMATLSCDSTDDILQPPAGEGPSIDLGIQKTVDRGTAEEGSLVTFTVTVTNLGPVDATGVHAGDTLPAGLIYTGHSVSTGSFDASDGVWEIGDLNSGGDAVLSLSAQVAEGTNGNTLVNRAVVISTVQHDSLLANNLASAQVFVGEPATGVVFRSDWGHATGIHNDALMDGPGTSNWRWNEFFCSSRHDVLQVVSGSGVGWSRTANVFRVQHTGVDGVCGAIQRREVVPPQTTHWGRLYFRSENTTWDSSFHNFSYNFVGDIQVVFFNPNGRPDGWRAGFGFDYFQDGSSIPSDQRAWLLRTQAGNPPNPGDVVGTSDPHAILLEHETWYRYEWMMEYVTPTTIRFWPRIYEMNGTVPLYDSDNYYRLWHESRNLTTWYADGNAFGYNPSNGAQLMRHIGIGNEGRSGGSEAFWYVADFAISVDGWIGPN
jgi:uncharacterized repeat protein (TIGR01451 family)